MKKNILLTFLFFILLLGISTAQQLDMCVTVWKCNWTECIDSSQTYICKDVSECGTNSSRPSEHGTTRNCEVLKDCIDNDRDGYGEGTDCVGPDIDDTDPTIRDTLTAGDVEKSNTEESPFKSTLFYIIVALFILAAVIAAFIVILVIINSSKKPVGDSIAVSESKREVRADF